MKVQVEDVNAVKKTLHIEVPEETVAEALDNAYRELKKGAKVKGFRPGKAPRSVLERMYGKDVHADVASRLIQNSFSEAVREQNLKVVGAPQLDPPKLNAKSAYLFDATVEVRPELADIDFEGLKLKRTLYEAGEKEIDGQLKVLQKNMAKKEKIEEDRPVRKDDHVVIDYEGLKDGEPYAETGKTENYTMRVGSAEIAEAFDDQVIGMKAGESREIEIGFPDDHANEKLRSQTIAFKVLVREIRKETLPEIDDAFAKSVGKFETLQELKDTIRENLEQGYEKRKEQELNEQIFQALISKTEFEVPEVMVEYELEQIIQDAERSFSYYNRSLEEAGLSREVLAREYRETAEKQVRRHLILAKIIEQEKLELSAEDLDRGFQEMAQRFNQSASDIKAYYDQNPDKLDYFKHTLLEKQAINVILNKSDIEDVSPPEEDPDASQADAADQQNDASTEDG